MGIDPVSFPEELYDILLSVWRERAGARVRTRGAGGLTTDQMHAVARRVRDLSRGFTGDRALAGERYLGDPELLGAYLLHFWPISWCQATVCMEMLRRRGSAMPRRALDIGAGPGPVAMALLGEGVKEVTACDRSGAALGIARRIGEELGPVPVTRQWDATTGGGVPKGPWDLISLGHALNELWAGHPQRIELRVSFLARMAEELADGGRLLLIEPALMQTAQDAIRVRDGLVRAGFVVELPCIWQADCPALPGATCHGEFPWRPSPGMVRLSHMARIGRETLKMAWFVLRKGAPGAEAPPRASTPEDGIYRVVSEPLLSKAGRIRYLVCGPLGRFALSAPRECPGPGVKPFYSLRRGEGIRIGGALKRESGWGLDRESRVEIIERLPGGG